MSGITKSEHSERVKKMSIASNCMFFLFSLIYYFTLLVWTCLYETMYQKAGDEMFLIGTLSAAIIGLVVTFPFLKEKVWYGRWVLTLAVIVLTIVNMVYAGSMSLLFFIPMSVLCLLNFDRLFVIIIGVAGLLNALLQLTRLLYDNQTTKENYMSFAMVIFIGCMYALALGMVNRLVGKSYKCVVLDLNRENRIHKSLYEKSTLDSTTELLNRNAYNEYLECFRGELRKSMCCIYIDVNGLHEYNNTYGHAEGDKMLHTVALEMRKSFVGQSVYRIGGDEFVILAEDLVFRDCADRLQQLKQNIKEHQIHIAVGMEWRDENMDIEDMIKTADAKMYQDKDRFYQIYSENHNGVVIYERAVR